MSDISRQLSEAVPEQLTQEFHRELRTGWELKKVKAKHDQAWMGKLNHQGVDRSVDGIGQLIGRIHPDSYHFWGMKLGYNCWKDKGFLNEYFRDNPECVVKTQAKTQILVDTKIVDTSGKPIADLAAKPE